MNPWAKISVGKSVFEASSESVRCGLTARTSASDSGAATTAGRQHQDAIIAGVGDVDRFLGGVQARWLIERVDAHPAIIGCVQPRSLLGCPNTLLAAWPSRNGGRKPNARWYWVSATTSSPGSAKTPAARLRWSGWPAPRAFKVVVFAQQQAGTRRRAGRGRGTRARESCRCRPRTDSGHPTRFPSD